MIYMQRNTSHFIEREETPEISLPWKEGNVMGNKHDIKND